MTKIVESIRVPGPAEAVRTLWFDPHRRGAFIDDWGGIVKLDGWPEIGGAMVWQTRPGGDGWTREKRTAEDTVLVENEVLRGEKHIRIIGAQDLLLEVSFDYVAKERTPTFDWLFIRRGQRSSLRRTLQRFAIERESESGA